MCCYNRSPQKIGIFEYRQTCSRTKERGFTIPWDPLHKDGEGCRLLLRQGVVPILDLTEWSEQWGVLSYLESPKA